MPIKRKKPLKRSRPRAVNATRKAREFARCYHSEERVRFVKTLPCVACLPSRVPTEPSENAHIPSRSGVGRKGDYDQIVPLCRPHHSVLHETVPLVFEDTYYVNLAFCAVATEARWQSWQKYADSVR